MPAPVLLTERLRLDAHRADDLDALAAMWTQPEVHRFIGNGRPRGREEVWLRLLRAIGQWTAFGYGSWVVRDRASGAVLGDVGLMEARRELTPPLSAPEAAWTLAREGQGRGLAREALAAALGWADAHGLARTQCIVDPGNTRSIALAGRLGYVAGDTRPYHGKSVIVFDRTAA